MDFPHIDRSPPLKQELSSKRSVTPALSAPTVSTSAAPSTLLSELMTAVCTARRYDSVAVLSFYTIVSSNLFFNVQIVTHTKGCRRCRLCKDQAMCPYRRVRGAYPARRSYQGRWRFGRLPYRCWLRKSLCSWFTLVHLFHDAHFTLSTIQKWSVEFVKLIPCRRISRCCWSDRHVGKKRA